MQPVRTARLILRPVTREDAADPRILHWHTDPAGYAQMYQRAQTPGEAVSFVRRMADLWAEHGLGYWIAEHDRVPVGIGGVSEIEHAGQTLLNIYYRLDPSTRGRGFAREIACAATSFAAQWRPDLNVVARVAPTNEPSLRVAAACGLIDVGTWREASEPAHLPSSRLLRSPVVLEGDIEADGPEGAALVDLWCRVNDAGGAVGFEPGAPRAAVAATARGHLVDPNATLVRLLAPTGSGEKGDPGTGELLGFGFVVRGDHPRVAHRSWLVRVMTAPEHRRRNIGRVLVGAMHGQARRAGCELVHVDYRGGTGLGAFYAACGYVETARVPGGLRFGFGERDDVGMTRRLDGRLPR